VSNQPDLNALLIQWWGGTYESAYISGIICDASNLVFGTNPPYALADFVAVYPQFANVDAQGTYQGGVVPQAVLQLYINLASACVQQVRWKDMWLVGMSLFIAHFCTLWLQSSTEVNPSIGKVAAVGVGKGIQVSKGAGDLNVSYQTIVGDLPGWAAFLLTVFGQQFATMAQIVGFGAMYIY
jgi:hypothetical protein